MNVLQKSVMTMLIIAIMLVGTLVTGVDQGHALAAATYAPRPNELLYRAQIWIHVCNRRNANTDDSVGVSLNGRNTTWLNYPHDDFERNSRFTYDLMLERVRSVADIAYLKIHKRGSDGLAIRAIAFYLNNRQVYTQDFGSSCHSLDNDNGHRRDYTISLNRLRSHSLWRGYRQPPLPTSISRNEIISRIASIVGTGFRTVNPPSPIRSVKWDRANAISVTRRGNRSLAVRLYLEAEIPGPNPSITVKFDLDLSCSNGRLKILSTRPQATVLGITRTAGARIDVDMNIGSSQCPAIRVMNDGTVRLTYP